MQAVLSFCVLCLLLVAGKAVRTAVPFLRKLFLPSSLIAGAIGLVLLTFWGDGCLSSCHKGWSSLPGFLINIVFATLFATKQGALRAEHAQAIERDYATGASCRRLFIPFWIICFS